MAVELQIRSPVMSIDRPEVGCFVLLSMADKLLMHISGDSHCARVSISTAQSWLNVVGARMSNVRISCPTLGLVTLAGSRCTSSLTHISPVFPAQYLYFTTSLPIEGLKKLPARILFLRNLASLQQNVGVRQRLPLAPRLIGRIEQQGPRDESCRMDPENLEALHARCMSGRPRRQG